MNNKSNTDSLGCSNVTFIFLHISHNPSASISRLCSSFWWVWWVSSSITISSSEPTYLRVSILINFVSYISHLFAWSFSFYIFQPMSYNISFIITFFYPEITRDCLSQQLNFLHQNSHLRKIIGQRKWKARIYWFGISNDLPNLTQASDIAIISINLLWTR